jgi:hypothetical protein
MSDKRLTDKERALLAAARREVEAKATRHETVDTARAAPSAPRKGNGRATDAHRQVPRAAVSPLDAPTVLGWDHPAAQAGPKAAADKWARVAALMEAERGEADEKRRRMRRRAFAVLGFLCIAALIAFGRALIR